jgi:hypothetical protein
MTTRFASMKRSTQFCIQGSSLLSSLPEEILPVMHLRKQVSVREWIAVAPLVSKQHIEVTKMQWCRGRMRDRRRVGRGYRTLLDTSLLRLVDDELLQVLLFRVGHLGDVDVSAA